MKFRIAVQDPVVESPITLFEFCYLSTSNNQRLWSAFDDLDTRLSLLCQRL